MRDYIIMTDSCCDLNAHMAQELELNVVPLTVHMNGKDYANMLDGSEISFEEFYKNIRSGILSTTSAANVGQFEDAMRAVLDTGKDIVCVCFSSALSTTYQSATIAADDLRADYPEREIYVVDSLSASLGHRVHQLLQRSVRHVPERLHRRQDYGGRVPREPCLRGGLPVRLAGAGAAAVSGGAEKAGGSVR